MRALLVACSRTAYARMLALKEAWERQEPETELFLLVKCASLPEISADRPLSEEVGAYFSRVDAIVFCSAAGIAVRSIAPWLVHKSSDPAVLVMDEGGAFCIPLLSGHWGRANELAEMLSGMTGSIPVITTATDREGKFAVDVFARKNDLFLTDWKLAKRISARILEGHRILLHCGLPVEGEVPPELMLIGQQEEMPETGDDPNPEENSGSRQAKDSETDAVWISVKRSDREKQKNGLFLIPRIVVAGIGCRKGTPPEKIEAAAARCLEEADIAPEAVCMAASIDLKKEEKGLCQWCRERQLPFRTFSAKELGQATGDFTPSAFVESVTGVDNVCERSAVLAAGEGAVLLCRKKGYDGVTVALALKKASVRF